MPTLNRFPLLGLWAEEAARCLGYPRDEAESFGHAYAVLYAIRATRTSRVGSTANGAAHGRSELPKQTARERVKLDSDALDVCRIKLGGDLLDVRCIDGHVRGVIGGGDLQSPASYQTSIVAKFPPGYYKQLENAFHRLFRTLSPRALRDRLLYDVYDEWKRACGVGRLVDLDRLLAWCHARTELLAFIEAKGREVSEALQVLKQPGTA